jgi:V8-like Glu-specific endopeptidase
MARKVTSKSKRQKDLEAAYRQEVALELMQRGSSVSSGAGGLVQTEAATLEARRRKHRSMSNQPSPSALPNAERPSFGELGAPVGDGDVTEVPFGQEGLAMAEMAPALDEDLLLDAWYAEYGDPSTRLILRQPELTGSVLEVVIGEDDRLQVKEQTASYPWRCICSLRITANDGTMWIGTGWLNGPRTVVTAGHCVFIHGHGGWVRQIEVIPGRNGTERPFDSCVATTFRSVEGWTEDRDRDFDYGAILLPASCRYGDRLGWFGFANFGDPALDNLNANLAGYPGDKPPGTQWFHARAIKQITQHTVFYDIDTAGGQSGAPLWVVQEGSRYGIAVHTNGALTGNSATRITEDVFENLVNWRNEAA